MPTDDFFVKKASIYLVIGASIRSISCYWIVTEGATQQETKQSFDEFDRKWFEAVTSEFAFEVPVYIYCSVTYCILYSFYRLYLTLRELFGLNLGPEKAKAEKVE